MTHAPIILFVYNRPDHTRRTLDALVTNAEAGQSHLYVFCDGPKNPAAIETVQAVRELIRNVTGFASITVRERQENWGLAKSIIAGVTEIIEQHGRVIVLEDDIVVSPYFLRYMNSALVKYETEPRVACIHGWNYPLKNENLPDTFFLRGADCWGWATWKRAWDIFEADAQKLLAELIERKLTRQFDLDGAYAYTQMLRDQIAGKVNSWAIRWHASAFLRDMLTLHPSRSLVQNIGLDGTGVHSGNSTTLRTELTPNDTWNYPQDVEEDTELRKIIITFLHGLPTASTKLSFLKKLRTRVGKLYSALRKRASLHDSHS